MPRETSKRLLVRQTMNFHVRCLSERGGHVVGKRRAFQQKHGERRRAHVSSRFYEREIILQTATRLGGWQRPTTPVMQATMARGTERESDGGLDLSDGARDRV